MVYREGEHCTHIYFVINGEFEVSKKIRKEFDVANEGFDMQEFLPQKKNKSYKHNVKNGRFINAVNTFKSKGVSVLTENIRIKIIGVGNIIGDEDAVKDRYYSTTVTCFSTVGQVYAISIEHFHKGIK